MRVRGSFGRWIKERRRALDLTQAQFADQVHCSVATIRQIERDKRRPSRQMAERIADVLALADEERPAFVSWARQASAEPPALPNAERQQVMAYNNLPWQPTPFVGRQTELTQLADQLTNPLCRLLTLAGPGGIGKTRLALQVASGQLHRFADGVYYVPLAPLHSSGQIAWAIASALNISFQGAGLPERQLIRFLSGKHLLLVLDDFEQVIDGTGLLSDILSNAPSVKLLVTSREVLNLSGEWTFIVDGLAFPADQEDRQLETYSAVQLFIQQARQTQAGFTLDDNAQAVVAICQAVQGLPLGIELAATWVRVAPCSEIVRQLQQDLDILSNPHRNVPERHQSLRTVFDHSWGLLSDAERLVLGKLAVFRGGFDLEAAEQVAGATLTHLARLVDKSFVRLNPSGRYSMHELLRQYAFDHLTEPGEVRMMRQRHFAYFCELAAKTENHLYGPAQESWFDRLEQDHANIQAALAWSVKENQAEAGLQLAVSLEWFWILTSHDHEGSQWLNTLVALAPDAPASLSARALRCAAVVAPYERDIAQVRLFAETSLTLAYELGDRRSVAWALGTLGFFIERWDNLSQGIARLYESLALFRELNDGWGISHMLRRLGWELTLQEDYDQAIPLLEEALTLARAAKDKNATAWALLLLGNALWFQRYDARQVMILYHESLALSDEIREKSHLAELTFMLGEVARSKGDYGSAQSYYGQCLVAIQKMGAPWLDAAQSLAALGRLNQACGRPESAARLFGAADILLRGTGGELQPFATRAGIDQDMAAARNRLGDVVFKNLYAEGQMMSLDQAITYAMKRL